MATAPSPASSVSFAVVMLGLSVGAWWWRSEVVSSTVVEVPKQPWQQVKEKLPMPAPVTEEPSLTGENLQFLIEANPFSRLRRYVPPPEPGPGQIREPAPKRPVLRYKGRIQLRQRQRAILEDLAGGKTHFLEVGQEVAGYKLLDISEDQVLLSDLQTNEEVRLSLTPKESPE